MKTLLAFVAAASTAAIAALTAAPQPSDSKRLTIEQLLDIKHPSNPVWSADGRHITFTWDRAGVSQRYVSDLDGREPHLATDALQAPGGPSPNGVSSPDGSRVALVRSNADASSVASGSSRTSPAPAAAQSGRGGRGGRGSGAAGPSELWVRTVADGRETKILSQDSGIGGVSWSPDGAYILYTVGGGAVRHEQTPAYSGAKIIYTINENVPG